MSIQIEQKNTFIESALSLGELVYQAWKQKDYNPSSLVEIATEALKESRIHEKFNFDQFVAYFCKMRELPEQLYPRDGFGKPSITLFRKGDLVLDLYFWDHVDTNIHSHGFCGAFTPIYGRSLHSEYTFSACDGELGRDQVVLGELKLSGCNIANTGEVFPIVQGSSFVHQVIHFETPAVTFLVRTVGAVNQYSYRAGVAYLHAPTPVISLKHSNLLKLLSRMKHTDGAVFLKSIIEGCLRSGDEHAAVRFLFENYFNFLDLSEAENFIGAFPGFSRLQTGLTEALRDTEERTIFYNYIPDEPSRLLTSALITVESWQELSSLIKQYEPTAEPKAFVREKLRLLLQQGGLPVRLNEIGASIFLSLFDGMSEEQVFQQIIRNFDVPDNVSEYEEVKADIAKLKSQIESTRIFKALF